MSDNKKKKSILCFGNPIMDSYLLTTEEILKKHGIKKGEMAIYDSLTPPEELQKMRKEYSFTEFEVGGSSINTLKAYKRLGGEAALCCSYGADDRGEMAIKEFESLGIKNYCVLNNEYPTSYLMIFVTPDASRTVVGSFYPSFHLDSSKADYSIIKDYDYTFVETYSFDNDPKHDSAHKTLENIEKYEKKMIFALSNAFYVKSYNSSVVKFAFNKFCKVLIGNTDEYFGLFEGTKTAKEVVDKVVEYNKQHNQWEIVLITDGAKGAWVVEGVKANFIEAPEVEKVIDTTGAGDYFAAGILFALLNGYGFEAASVLSKMLSGHIISKVGVKVSDETITEAKNYLKTIS